MFVTRFLPDRFVSAGQDTHLLFWELSPPRISVRTLSPPGALVPEACVVAQLT